jgi:multidrug efflux system membrane fusion protein
LRIADCGLNGKQQRQSPFSGEPKATAVNGGLRIADGGLNGKQQRPSPFSGEPKATAVNCGLWIADCGLNGKQQRQSPFSGEPKATACLGHGVWRALALVLVTALALAGCKKDPGAAAQGPPPPVLPVVLATVVQRTVPLQLRNFGTVQPFFTVAVKSQITGILQTIHFRKGQDVKKGDLLFSIDPRPCEAALRQTEANLAKDAAQFKNAEKEAHRQAELLKKGFVAQDAYDEAETAADALAAAMKAAAAAIETAKLNLAYCSISAPIDGRVGDYLVDAGNLVRANDMSLVVINQVRPIEVNFSLPERDLAAVQENMAKAKLKVQAVIPGQEGRPETGELVFVNNTVDRATGQFQLLASFANPESRLWPGQYVNATLTVSEQPSALVIPSRAIQPGQKGEYVWVVRPDKTVEDRLVTVERVLNSESIISKGLKAGEEVVVDGQLRLVPGATVQAKPSPDVREEAKPGPEADKSAKPSPEAGKEAKPSPGTGGEARP